ncbi:hypothetical protein FK216_07070 [Moraxellaceae bacterium AER2_44_116]|nr:hypothetical protein [Moraxellaceae bacterium]TQC98049.1 hypothetical protein FK216_07070 [Moraxellaceae bacterium AER2_44_116]
MSADSPSTTKANPICSATQTARAVLLWIYKFINKNKAVLFASVLILTCLAFYAYQFYYDASGKDNIDKVLMDKFGNNRNPLSPSNADWGTFGDFFGGVMNPILGFINLFLLSSTLSLQIKSSQDQTKNTQIQEASAKIVAIGHLLEITTHQITNLSNNIHLLKDDEIKILEELKNHHSEYLNELHGQYKKLNDSKKEN